MELTDKLGVTIGNYNYCVERSRVLGGQLVEHGVRRGFDVSQLVAAIQRLDEPEE